MPPPPIALRYEISLLNYGSEYSVPYRCAQIPLCFPSAAHAELAAHIEAFFPSAAALRALLCNQKGAPAQLHELGEVISACEARLRAYDMYNQFLDEERAENMVESVKAMHKRVCELLARLRNLGSSALFRSRRRRRKLDPATLEQIDQLLLRMEGLTLVIDCENGLDSIKAGKREIDTMNSILESRGLETVVIDWTSIFSYIESCCSEDEAVEEHKSRFLGISAVLEVLLANINAILSDYLNAFSIPSVVNVWRPSKYRIGWDFSTNQLEIQPMRLE